MKPIKLIISAFGPYAGLMPEINFEQFDRKGLFLVTGETGAGKTMIFDAICFALFGTASGQWRDVKNLRSDHAADSTETFVDFYFSHQGRNYHVWRRPGYMRKAKRGSGETEEKAKAILYQDNIPIADGINPVSQAVEALLHVSEKQFKQIAMIAQGEFREMLNAKTADRTVILRKIFQTDGYEKLTSKLKDRMDTSFAERKRRTESIAQHFCDMTAEPGSETAAALLQLQERTRGSGDAWTVDELLDMTDRMSNADALLLQKLEAEFLEADASLKNSRDALAVAQNNNKALEDLDTLKKEQARLAAAAEEMQALETKLNQQKTASRQVSPKDIAWQRKCAEVTATAKKIETQKQLIDQAAEQKDAADKALEEALSLKPEADQLQLLVRTLSDEEEKYTQRDNCLKDQLRHQKRAKQLEQEESELTQAENELKKRIEQLAQTVETLKSSPADCIAAEAVQEKLQHLDRTLADITGNKLTLYRNSEEQLATKQQAFLAARSAYDNAAGLARDAEHILEDCRAGILAATLQEGQKCPVCGSVHHPEPAVLPGRSVTEEQVKQLQDKEKQLREEKNLAYTSAETEKTALDGQRKQLEEAIRECLADPILESEIPQTFDALLTAAASAGQILAQKLSESGSKISALKSACTQLRAAETALTDARGTETDTLARRRQTLIQNRSKLGQEASATAARLETLSGLRFASLAEAQKEKQRAQKRAGDILSAIDVAQNNQKKAEIKLSEARSVLGEQQSSHKTQTDAAATLLTALETAVKDNGFTSIEEMRMYVVSEPALVQTERRISDYRQNVRTNAALLEKAEKETAGMTVVDLSELRELCDSQEDLAKALSDHKSAVSGRISLNAKKRTSIAEHKEPLAAARKNYQLSRRLYELVRGTTGNGKVTLEQYVQAAGFDGIIAAANRRLEPMSDGQFQLRRQENSRNLQSGTFLDLEVIDTWTGRSRPVGNISGGESFKASLSLALGLADKVSSNLGGVQLDALFVDEGFGTLDGKSIDNALDILTSLSQKNRLVGIISHREELKAAISNKIVVTKSRKGSSIDIEVGD